MALYPQRPDHALHTVVLGTAVTTGSARRYAQFLPGVRSHSIGGLRAKVSYVFHGRRTGPGMGCISRPTVLGAGHCFPELPNANPMKPLPTAARSAESVKAEEFDLLKRKIHNKLVDKLDLNRVGEL